jgi:hypothetical protein
MYASFLFDRSMVVDGSKSSSRALVMPSGVPQDPAIIFRWSTENGLVLNACKK